MIMLLCYAHKQLPRIATVDNKSNRTGQQEKRCEGKRRWIVSRQPVKSKQLRKTRELQLDTRNVLGSDSDEWMTWFL